MKYFDYNRAVIDILEKEFGHSDLHVGLAQRITKAIKVNDLLNRIRDLEEKLLAHQHHLDNMMDN